MAALQGAARSPPLSSERGRREGPQPGQHTRGGEGKQQGSWMLGPKSPNADDCPSHCHSLHPPSSTATAQPDSLQVPDLPPQGSLQTPCSVSNTSLDSLCTQPNSPREPCSVLDSTSVPTDSLDSLPRQPESLTSLFEDSLDPCDSLECLDVYPGRHPRSAFSLGDSLNTSSVPRDSLLSVTSLCDLTQASSIPSDSLESPCSLCDSLETPVTQQNCPGSRSV